MAARQRAAAAAVLPLLLAACAGGPAARTPGEASRNAPAASAPAPAASSAPAAASSLAACTLSLLGRGPLVLPAGLRAGGLDVGGLSGIAYLGGDRYLAITDNQKRTPARLFILEFAVGPDGPAPLPGKSARDVVTGVTRLAGFDGASFDGEGVAVTSGGNVLVSSETEPSIREFTPDGRLGSTLPVPGQFPKRRKHGIAGNLGFESLALSPEGNTLWTAGERALQQDAPGAGKVEASPARLLRYERTPDGFVPGEQLVYPIDAVEDPGTGSFAVRGLSELLALPGGGLLALEREFVEGRGNRIEIYAVSAAGASSVAGLDSLAGRPIGSPATAGSTAPVETTAGTITPVRKALLFDFADVATGGFAPDNIEGMTLGPALPNGDRTVVLVSDDNFMPLSQRTQLVALSLHCGDR